VVRIFQASSLNVRRSNIGGMVSSIAPRLSYLIRYRDRHYNIEYKILDFKEEVELKRRGEKRLEKHGNLQDVA
jgi:hypothetical protein